MILRHKKTLFLLVIMVMILTIGQSTDLSTLIYMPQEVRVFEGDNQTFTFALPVKISVQTNDYKSLKYNGDVIQQELASTFKAPLVLEAIGKGSTDLHFKLFGLIPIKRVTVNVLPKVEVIPGGHSIGVKLQTKGILVIGLAEVVGENGKSYHPALEGGITIGDYITKVNNIKVNDADHFSELISNSGDKETKLEVINGKDKKTIIVSPVKSKQDGKYRIGLYVRDRTTGVGTLSFYDPKTGIYGALGHGITDGDTGALLNVSKGQILKSRVVSVRKGAKNNPGEIHGIFSDKDTNLGNINKNTNFGIYGVSSTNIKNPAYNNPIPIAFQSQIKQGKAEILTTIDDEKIEKFDIEIVKVNKQSSPGVKSMVIKVTDQRLIEKTGGIVQGMSGSPIIQNGRLVGVVTHVFLNDPTKGYGIFIEWMLNEGGVNINKKSA